MVNVRVLRVLAVLPYVVVGALIAFTLGSKWGQWPDAAIDLALCAAIVVWMLAFRTFRLPWTERPSVVAVFMTGMILLTLALVLRDSSFGLLVIGCFIYAYSMVAWPWELLAVGVVAVVAGIAQSTGIDRSTSSGIVATTAVIAFNVVVMCGLSWIFRLTHREFQRSGMEAERHRLAHEIHDTLAQCLAGIVTQLQAAQEATDALARERHTSKALGLARDGLTEARSSMQALRPPVLEEARLPDAIENITRAWTARTGITVATRVLGVSASLPTDAEVALLRTVQECLTNTERHAHADRVTLTLHYRPDRAMLEVKDDGTGFDAIIRPEPDTDGHGYGLVAMRERIEALTGTLTIDSRRGRGTTIRAEVPA